MQISRGLLFFPNRRQLLRNLINVDWKGFPRYRWSWGGCKDLRVHQLFLLVFSGYHRLVHQTILWLYLLNCPVLLQSLLLLLLPDQRPKHMNILPLLMQSLRSLVHVLIQGRHRNQFIRLERMPSFDKLLIRRQISKKFTWRYSIFWVHVDKHQDYLFQK